MVRGLSNYDSVFSFFPAVGRGLGINLCDLKEKKISKQTHETHERHETQREKNPLCPGGEGEGEGDVSAVEC